MFGMRAKKVALLIGLIAVFLVVSMVVVNAIDTHYGGYGIDVWHDRKLELLWLFLIGCLLFPNVFHRYRTLRRRERTIPWYRCLDLTLCLLALVSGLLFATIALQQWVIFLTPGTVPGSDIGPTPFKMLLGTYQPLMVGYNHVNSLTATIVLLDLCWLLLILFLLIQAVGLLFARLIRTPAIQEGFRTEL